MSRFLPPSEEELAARGLSPDGSPIGAAKVRARKSDGTLKADDPSTPDINEAWVGGKAPKKSAKSANKKE